MICWLEANSHESYAGFSGGVADAWYLRESIGETPKRKPSSTSARRITIYELESPIYSNGSANIT